MDEIEIDNHGSLGWSCAPRTVPLSEISAERLTTPILFGKNKGKVGVFVRCPECEKQGRTSWHLLEVQKTSP